MMGTDGYAQTVCANAPCTQAAVFQLNSKNTAYPYHAYVCTAACAHTVSRIMQSIVIGGDKRKHSVSGSGSGSGGGGGGGGGGGSGSGGGGGGGGGGAAAAAAAAAAGGGGGGGGGKRRRRKVTGVSIESILLYMLATTQPAKDEVAGKITESINAGNASLMTSRQALQFKETKKIDTTNLINEIVDLGKEVDAGIKKMIYYTKKGAGGRSSEDTKMRVAFFNTELFDKIYDFRKAAPIGSIVRTMHSDSNPIAMLDTKSVSSRLKKLPSMQMWEERDNLITFFDAISDLLKASPPYERGTGIPPLDYEVKTSKDIVSGVIRQELVAVTTAATLMDVTQNLVDLREGLEIDFEKQIAVLRQKQAAQEAAKMQGRTDSDRDRDNNPPGGGGGFS
jgi:hypothetical protein